MYTFVYIKFGAKNDTFLKYNLQVGYKYQIETYFYLLTTTDQGMISYREESELEMERRRKVIEETQRYKPTKPRLLREKNVTLWV